MLTFYRHKKSIRYEQHGLILRHIILKGMSGQLVSAVVRVTFSLKEDNYSKDILK